MAMLKFNRYSLFKAVTSGREWISISDSSNGNSLYETWPSEEEGRRGKGGVGGGGGRGGKRGEEGGRGGSWGGENL